MPRILAIDYGTKRVGLAVTDPSGIIASALDTIHSSEVIDYLKKYNDREKVSLFVIGEPKHKDGNPMDVAVQINSFMNVLNRTFPDIPIERQDERYTSTLAFDAILKSGIGKEKRKDKKLVDKIAAVIILQNYLERKSYQ